MQWCELKDDCATRDDAMGGCTHGNQGTITAKTRLGLPKKTKQFENSECQSCCVLSRQLEKASEKTDRR